MCVCVYIYIYKIAIILALVIWSPECVVLSLILTLLVIYTHKRSLILYSLFTNIDICEHHICVVLHKFSERCCVLYKSFRYIRDILCLETSTMVLPHIQHLPSLCAHEAQYLPWFITAHLQVSHRDPQEAFLSLERLSSNLLTPTGRLAPFLTSGVMSLETPFSHFSHGIGSARYRNSCL